MTLSKLKRIAPLSAALVLGLINAIIGLIFGILGFFIALFMSGNPDIAAILLQAGLPAEMVDASLKSAMGLMIVYPIIGFISAFIGTFAAVWLYNLIAKKLPLKLEIK